MSSEKPTVKSQLVWLMRDALERDLSTNIPTSDPARISEVVVGKYTKEPRGLILSVYSDHPLGFQGGKHDSLAEGGPRAAMDRPYYFPPESIGGAKFLNIFGTVELRALQDMSPSDAVEVISEVETRIAVVINNDPDLVALNDVYGYHLFALETVADYGYASGGGNTAIDRHWCDWVARASFFRSR